MNVNDIGDASDVSEGADIPISKLSQDTETVKIAKIGRGVEFTDEALLSGYNNDIATEAADQILTAINSGVETRLLNAMSDTAILKSTIAASGNPADGVADAVAEFGEDMDGAGVLAVPPSFLTRLRKSESWIPNTEIGADMIIRGRVGMVHGLDVVPMNRLSVYTYTETTDTSFVSGKTYFEKRGESYFLTKDTEMKAGKTYYEKSATATNTAYIIRPGALAIFMKRDTLVEFDRDKQAQLNYIFGSKMFAPYVYDKSKLIKIALS